MKPWDEQIRKEHETLRIHAEVLSSTLGVDAAGQDRRVVMNWTVRNLWPEVELHLRKEETVFFAKLKQLIGENAGALTLLEQEHAQLRAGMRRLSELLQHAANPDWDRIRMAVNGFLDQLEEHERLTSGLTLDVLLYSLKPHELHNLGKAFEEVARKAHEEEGWPVAWWNRPLPKRHRKHGQPRKQQEERYAPYIKVHPVSLPSHRGHIHQYDPLASPGEVRVA